MTIRSWVLHNSLAVKRFLGYGLIVLAAAIALSGATVLVLNATYDQPEISVPANPAAGYDRVYMDSTTHKLSCLTSTGTSCAPSGGGGSFSVNGFYLNDGTNNYIGPTNQIATLPSAGIYSWINQGSATETAVQNALVVHAPATNSGISLNMRIAPISTNTSVTTSFICSYAMNDNEATGCVIGFYEAASGKAEGFQIVLGFVQVNRWNTPTSFGGNQLNANKAGTTTQVLWVRMTISGGVISFFYSLDGVNFAFAYSEASNAFFNTAPDNWFYGVDVQGATNDAFNTLLSWKAVP